MLGSVVWKSRRMVGIATVNTELSSTTMSAATTTIARVIQRRGSGTPGVCPLNAVPTESSVGSISGRVRRGPVPYAV